MNHTSSNGYQHTADALANLNRVYSSPLFQTEDKAKCALARLTPTDSISKRSLHRRHFGHLQASERIAFGGHFWILFGFSARARSRDLQFTAPWSRLVALLRPFSKLSSVFQVASVNAKCNEKLVWMIQELDECPGITNWIQLRAVL